MWRFPEQSGLGPSSRLDRSKDRLRFVDAPEREGSESAEIMLKEAALERLRQEQTFAELTA